MTAVPARSSGDLRRLPTWWLVTAGTLPIVLLAGWAIAVSLGGQSARVGGLAPDFSLVDLDGEPVRLADLRGRPVIVNFWASWCGPCVEEFPMLRDAAATHADDGLVVVGVVHEDRSEAARDFMARLHATWRAVMDPGGSVAAAYGIHGLPETFFIGTDGVIRGRQIGGLTGATLDEKLAAIIDEE